jgi:hypothetical protein
VAVTPGTATITGVGATTIAYSAVAKDANNNTIAGVTFTWGSADPGVATIPVQGGAALTQGLGTTAIQATGGGVTGAGSLTVTAHYYVDANAGSNANAGTSEAPFRTITKALEVAAAGNTIKVQPGRYGVGESFPLAGPTGVRLIGDETHKGGGTTPTSIIYGVGIPTFFFIPPPGALIAGFTITDSSYVGLPVVYAINGGVTFRNNRLVNSALPDIGLYLGTGLGVIPGSLNVISGNVIEGNTSGIRIDADRAKVENNTITNNQIGIEYGDPGGDLGGGATGSAGGNILSCNRLGDLSLTVAGLGTIAASNNQWDHVPLTTATSGGASGGVDFYNTGGTATLTTTGATVAPNNCP